MHDDIARFVTATAKYTKIRGLTLCTCLRYPIKTDRKYRVVMVELTTLLIEPLAKPPIKHLSLLPLITE